MSPMPPYLKLVIRDDGPHVSINPRDPAFYQDPYAAYAALFATGHPVFYWEEYGHWCFAGFDAVNALFRERQLGRQILHVATRQELGWPPRPKHLINFDAVERHSLLELEPPNHTRLRKLVNRAFVSRQVETLRPQITSLCNQLIDNFSESTELLKDYATPLPLTMICNLLGVPTKFGPQLLDWSHRIVKMYVLAPSMQDQIAADAAASEFADFLRGHISAHRQGNHGDLLSSLIAASDDGDALTEDELISTVVVLLNAGHEATVHQLGNALKSILESELDPSELFSSPEATRRTVEECIRHDAPLHMFTRYALADIQIHMDGAQIELKKGQQIGLMLGAANRDPRVFDKPDAFWPTRPNQANVSFGAGIHFCVGAPLARVELQVGLSALFSRIDGLKIADPFEYRDIYHFHGLDRLMLAT